MDPITLSILAASLGAGAGGLMASMGGKDEEGINIPAYYEDPNYQKVQDYSFPYYSSLLEGKNAYASPIGNWGGKELEDIIGLTSRDVTSATEGSLASSGMARSGLAATSIGSKVGDISKTLRWEDFNRAMTGRLNLINTGSAGMSGIRSAALTNQGQKNSYNLGRAGVDLSLLTNQQNQDTQELPCGEIY
jgi:hypothetical protein